MTSIPATITVTADTQAALVSALSSANAGDTIVFQTAGVISLSSTLVISKSITINGMATGGGTVTLQGTSGFTDVSVTGGTVTLENLIISAGTGTGTAGAAGTSANPQGGNGGDAAGGIFNNGGALTVTSVSFVNDTAKGGAGGTGYSWTDLSGSGGGGGGAGGSAAGAIFNESGTVAVANLSFTNVSATGGTGGDGGAGAGAQFGTVSGSLLYGGSGGVGGTDGQGGVDGQSGNPPGGGTGAFGGFGGTAAATGVAYTAGLTTAGQTGVAGTGLNGLGGGGGGGGAGGTSWQSVGGVNSTVPCFAEGVRLLTESGYVAVESLTIGDLLVTASGALRPIIWIGRRHIDLTTHPDSQAVMPVRIAPHCFGPGVPRHSVLLSPEHAVFMFGVLVPVGALVDGRGIATQHMDKVTYWHIELDQHDAVLAENLPCESFLENENRYDFEGQGPLSLHPMFGGSERACFGPEPFAPIRRQGPIVQRLRETVNAIDVWRLTG